jgi:hypothetical protein
MGGAAPHNLLTAAIEVIRVTGTPYTGPHNSEFLENIFASYTWCAVHMPADHGAVAPCMHGRRCQTDAVIHPPDSGVHDDPVVDSSSVTKERSVRRSPMHAMVGMWHTGARMQAKLARSAIYSEVRVILQHQRRLKQFLHADSLTQDLNEEFCSRTCMHGRFACTKT